MSQKVMSAHYFSSIPDNGDIYLFIYLLPVRKKQQHMLSVFAMLT